MELSTLLKNLDNPDYITTVNSNTVFPVISSVLFKSAVNAAFTSCSYGILN